ncbi:hypothetical protein [Nocardia sp. CC227C]|uniref:hypothetical protein n=1 Tax=Nocardia sp. CC227C TaxID=3044562 RepID=UPI00278BE8A4|nr:hypothetical protein [Nocardia sp. CC227C]
MTGAFFRTQYSRQGIELIPQAEAASGWGEDHMRGLAVSSALARAAEQRIHNLGSNGLEFINADVSLAWGRLPVGSVGFATTERIEEAGISVGTAVAFVEVSAPAHRSGAVPNRAEMADIESTQRSSASGIPAELAAAGFDDAEDVRLDTAEVLALTRATDGWIAALQLAVLSLRSGQDTGHLLDSLATHPDIGAFLAENVLDALDPQRSTFS